MRPRGLAVAAIAAGLFAATASDAAASTIVYVCGDDLCRADDSGAGRKRLTSDGATGAGAYSRPSVSLDGTELAYKRGDPGRVFTATLTPTGLTDVTRIEPSPDGPADATQYDVAIAPGGERVAWVEHRIDVTFGGVSYRPYTANVDGSDHQRPSDSTSRPFVGWFGDDALVRNGIAPSFPQQDAERVDQGLCATPDSCRTDSARQIAFDPAGRGLRKPAVSPDRRLVVATASREDTSTAVDVPGALVLFDAATASPIRELTPGPNDSYASFSPDGATVAFTRDGAVWTVPAAGGPATRLVADGAQPAWGALSIARLSHPKRARRAALRRRGITLRFAGLPRPATITATARGPRGARGRARHQTTTTTARVGLKLGRAAIRRLGRGRANLRLEVRVASPAQPAQRLTGKLRVVP